MEVGNNKKYRSETTNIDQTKENNPPQQNSKKGNATSATNRGQQENID